MKLQSDPTVRYGVATLAKNKRLTHKGLDTSGAYLEEADFTDASYTSETTWPEGFAPEAAGAVSM